MSIASFQFGLKSALPATLTAGAIYITTDTGELFFGNGNSGVKISDFVAVESYEDLPEAPLSNKFYYVTGDAIIYKYQDGEWTPIGGGGGGGTVNAGVGLEKSGSTIKAKLVSDTALSNAASAAVEVANRVYPVAVDTNGKLAVNVPWVNTEYESKTASEGGTDLSLVTTGEKYAWNNKSTTNGTVTSVAAGTGLATASGSAVTESGTLKVNLLSETALTNSATAATEVANRVYPVAVDVNGKLAVNVPWDDTTYESKSASSGGTDVSLVTTGEKATWNSKTSNTGTVTNVAAGVGLVTASGSAVTETGTIKAKLASETNATNASGIITNVAGRQYAVTPDSNGNLSVNVPWSGISGTWTEVQSGAVSATNVAITNPLNSTSITVDPYCENTGGTNGGTTPVSISEVVVTASTITLYFDALTVATDFKCLVY